MNIKTSKLILNKLKNYELPEEILPVFDLIKKHPGRLHFVKDHNGCKNVLFISTHHSERSIYEFPYFSFFTSVNDGGVPSIKVSHAPGDIYRETIKFLESTNEPLYVGIGFKECEVTNVDYFNILYMMEDTKCNVLDAFVSLRRFPDWYDKEADYPIYIIQERTYFLEMESNEMQFLMNKRNSVIEKLNQIVKKNDKKAFNALTKEIRAINQQLSEYKV